MRGRARSPDWPPSGGITGCLHIRLHADDGASGARVAADQVLTHGSWKPQYDFRERQQDGDRE